MHSDISMRKWAPPEKVSCLSKTFKTTSMRFLMSILNALMMMTANGPLKKKKIAGKTWA